MSFHSLQPGDMIRLGHYPQAADGAVLPIDWRVLATDAEHDRALVLSDLILDLQPFHDRACAVSWMSSSLRRWLREVLTPAAFSQEEQLQIFHPETASDPSGDILWALFGMEDVTSDLTDPVFLLSQADVMQYFPGESPFFRDASADVAPWVMARYPEDVPDARHSWWLRSSMSQMPMAYIVSPCDSIGASIVRPDYREGVRPAMWVRMC